MKVILFDLDGTLIDTAPELADALNRTLRRAGLPAVDEAAVRGWIGDGARALLAKALSQAGAPPAVALNAWHEFAWDYADCCGSRSTVFEGVRPLLARLRAQGLRLAVLTNKEANFAHRLLARHDLADAFELLVAGDTLSVKKPHPGMVQHALAALQAEPHECLLVGDSLTDLQTARAAGIGIWLVRHGYPQGVFNHPPGGPDAPDGVIEHFDDFQPLPAQRVAIV
ncbi:HAD-IIIA family hydrolase [Aquabacterium sp. OR-4]|uniref:HAD-IIIA family hydrolase n=1 Tax=Aquabacterium sp. OR-4 TaxID=2978127 RepID=UPI0021B28C85|nr:HAD-IIIA family hydrolase [Aquabacterium sp. OR-4]MDT7836411.1 HAD-IIIA family hydrolase [Aquabacterium sp. OR-4]